MTLYHAHGNTPTLAYCRQQDLPELIGIWPSETIDKKQILRSLNAALNCQRRYARTSSWRYNLNHHIRLLAAIKAEKATLATALSCK